MAKDLQDATHSKAPVTIYYDGDCPFCANYVRVARLRETFEVTLVNAREDRGAVERFARKGMDLSNGMVVEFPEATHYGADAVNVLSLTSSRRGWVNATLASVFRSRTLSRFFYPAMKTGRRVTLALQGKELKIRGK
ncbi:MAG: DCC1-like thiol-disulfide oxidoreductase family protein [Pseudomonadota bacterium]